MKMQALTQIIGFGVPAVGASIGAVKSFGFVPEGHIGVKLRWEKVVRYRENHYDLESQKIIHHAGDVIYYGSGWRWIIPFTHKFRTVSSVDQYHDLPQHKVRLKDDTIFLIKAALGFRVIKTEAYTTMFGVEDYHKALVLLCVTKLRELLSEKNQGDLRGTKDINEALLIAVKDGALAWGIEILSFNIVESDPTHDTEMLIQTPRFIEQRATSLRDHASKLDEVDPAIATALLGGAAITLGNMPTRVPVELADVIPIQVVPEPSQQAAGS
jgi:regulator of protease activity HflC (stomatin/prohibitin superfamily)